MFVESRRPTASSTSTVSEQPDLPLTQVKTGAQVRLCRQARLCRTDAPGKSSHQTPKRGTGQYLPSYSAHQNLDGSLVDHQFKRARPAQKASRDASLDEWFSSRHSVALKVAQASVQLFVK